LIREDGFYVHVFIANTSYSEHQSDKHMINGDVVSKCFMCLEKDTDPVIQGSFYPPIFEDELKNMAVVYLCGECESQFQKSHGASAIEFSR